MSTRFGLFWLVACLAAAPTSSASAQDGPADVAVVAPDVELPPTPEGFQAEVVGDVRWEYPSQASEIAERLQGVYARAWPRVTDELGGALDGAMVIRIGRNHAEMSGLAPARAPPPEYASGVAYPHRGLVLLSLTEPSTNEQTDVDSVLVHELSHIALHRAVDGHPVPRWFSEGVAIYQARERSFERVRTLWGATVGGRLMSLEQLEREFPRSTAGVGLAYAQSADFVEWLRGRENGATKLRDVVRRVREGQSFTTALERTYSASMTRLEIDWHDSLGERFRALPLLAGSGAVWVLAAFLIVVAYARRRQRDRARFAQWAEEERAAAAKVVVPLATVDVASTDRHPPGARSPTEPDRDDLEVLYVVPPEPGRHAGVPTVEHEGRSHTLH
ncbi:MAG: hypothetical protein KF729_23580 [Sandaracinaceae bacterium]|nr:hypothetical protein [Sandaracinaceae bacterium]